MKLAEAKRLLAKRFGESCRRGVGGPKSGDAVLDAANRVVIRACRDEHGAAWLGCINHYHGMPQGMWKWDGCRVRPRAADFVLPQPSEGVALAIGRYRNTPVDRCCEWSDLLDLINTEIELAGGVLLAWS